MPQDSYRPVVKYRGSGRDEFDKMVDRNVYPWIASEIPEVWKAGNPPAYLIWDDSRQVNLALYWIDDLNVTYSDCEPVIESVKREYEIQPDEYACGLHPVIVVKIDSVDDIQKIDHQLITVSDLLVMGFYKGSLISFNE